MCARAGCSNVLPPGSHPNRRYCSARCKDQAKHALAVERHSGVCAYEGCQARVDPRSRFCGDHRPGRPAQPASTATTVAQRLSSVMAQRHLNIAQAAKQIGIAGSALSRTLHRDNPGRPMNRATAEKLSRWDGGWSAATYRRWATRAPAAYEQLRARGRALGASGMGVPKSLQHVERIQRSLHRTMVRLYGPRWPTVRAKMAGASSRARKGQSTKPRTEQQRAAARERRKDSLFYGAIGALHRLRRAGPVSTTDLLVLEDQARASGDATKAVRNAIDKQRGPHPTYTLDEVRLRMARGEPPKRIGAALAITERHAQRLVRLVADLDADQKRQITPPMRESPATN